MSMKNHDSAEDEMKTLYYGGKILTLGEPLYAEALVEEGGRILAVGEEAVLRASLSGEYAETDLSGRVLMPGFIDAHGHFNSIAAASVRCSLRDADSVDEIRRRIRAFIKEKNVAPGEWIRAADYDENFLPGAKHPGIEELDSFCPDNPLMIGHKTGHAALYNSRAFEICGVTADTPAPAGGEIGKTDGKLNGYMSESACGLCNSKIPPMSTEEFMEGCISAQQKYAAYGITTVQDGYLVSRSIDTYLALASEDKLKLDIIGYIPIGSYRKLRDAYAGRMTDPRVKIGGAKTFADGSPQIRTAWLRAPYLGGNDHGEPNRSDEKMLEGISMAAEEHAQVLCHANGDAAIEQFLRTVEAVEKEHPDYKETRPVVIHGQLMGQDQLPLAREVGAVVSFFVAHTYHWGDVHIKNLGIERGMRISPVRSALEEGVRVTFHQDPPVILPDMFETLWCAANRITRSGVVLDGEQVSVLDALRAVTIGSAYQYHEENIKGTLEAGKQADFIIVDRDPLEIPKETLRDVQILSTYKRGECIYSK